MRHARLVPLALLSLAAACGTATTSIRSERPASLISASASEWFVFAEERGSETAIWMAGAEKPSVRYELVHLSHAGGWNGRAALSPDGRRVAITLLPPGASDPDHAAEVWEADLQAQSIRRLAKTVDLRSALVWAPDGSSITFERVTGPTQAIWRVRTWESREELLATPIAGELLMPVAYRAGALLCARYSDAGADLVELDNDGQITRRWHATDSVARNMALSPNQREVAFLAIASTATGNIYEASAIDLETGSVRHLQSPAESVGIAWAPDGRLTLGLAGSPSGLRDASGHSLFPPPRDGFEQPLAWSSTGRHLAVRQFSGPTTAAPGMARDGIRSTDGDATAILASGPVRFVGWIPLSRPIRAP